MLAKFKSTKCVLSNVNSPAKKAVCCIVGSTIAVGLIYGGYVIINNPTIKNFLESQSNKLSISLRTAENICIGYGVIISPIGMTLFTRDMFRTLKYDNKCCSIIRKTMSYSVLAPVFILSMTLAICLIVKRY